MNITYVSALYDIYNARYTSQRLANDVTIMLKQKMKLILFVDKFYYDIVSKMGYSNSVTIIELPIESLHIYNMIMANKHFLHLPHVRNYEKDTYEYIALMNSKIEFLHRALNLIETEYVAWIDAGVSKMFSNKEDCFSRLTNIIVTGLDKVLIPGCYIRHISFDELCQSIWWLFLGTFFICHRNYVDKFYGLSLTTLMRFCINGYIPWEVNIWAQIMYDNSDTFEWYYSKHDDGLTHLPGKFLKN